MTVNDLDEIVQYLQSLGYGHKQVIVQINHGAGAHLACDTYTGLTNWCGNEAVLISAAPLLLPENRGTIISYNLDDDELEEIRIARETAPTIGLITSPV